MQATDLISLPSKAVEIVRLHTGRLGTLVRRFRYAFRIALVDSGYWQHADLSGPPVDSTAKKSAGLRSDGTPIDRMLGDISGPGVQVLGYDIWTEGKVPCKSHCYHDLPVSGRHVKEMGLKRGCYHSDSVCCKCTHGVCSTAQYAYLNHVVSFSAAIESAGGTVKK
jgi:hypothetical protein